MYPIQWLHKRKSNTQIDNAKGIDVVISMHNLMEHSNNYSKTSESLWQCNWDKPVFTDAGTTTYFSAANSKGVSFRFK